MRNQPTEKSKPTQTHEKSTQRTHTEIKTNSYPREINPKNTEKSKPKTQTTIQNYRNQIAQISPQTQDL